MKTRSAWIGACALIVATIITVVFSRSEKKPNIIVQKNDSGANYNAGRDIYKSGRDQISAGHDVTVNNNSYYSDTTKNNSKNSKKKSNSEPTYNITSYNQKGGITAGSVLVLNKAILILDGKIADDINIAQDYYCELDTVSKIIKFHPKSGEWETMFVGIPDLEREKISPHFSNQAKNLSAMKTGTFYVRNDSLFAMINEGQPSTNKFYYSLHYEELPSYVVFGNYSGPLYKLNLLTH